MAACFSLFSAMLARPRHWAGPSTEWKRRTWEPAVSSGRALSATHLVWRPVQDLHWEGLEPQVGVPGGEGGVAACTGSWALCTGCREGGRLPQCTAAPSGEMAAGQRRLLRGA
jgi:hypothetical protein